MGAVAVFSMSLSLTVCLLFGHLPRRVGATQRYPPRSRRLCCRGRGAHPFHTEQNREPSAAVALLLWRVLAQGSTTWEPRRGPTWAGHRPEGSVGGGLLATHGWRVFGIFRGSHPGSPLNRGGSGRLRRLCSPARAGGLTSLGGANRCRGSASQAGQAPPTDRLFVGWGGHGPPGEAQAMSGLSDICPALDDYAVGGGASARVQRVRFYARSKIGYLPKNCPI